MLDPRTKILLTIAFIVSAVLLPDGAWRHFAAFWGLMMISIAFSKITLRYVLTRSIIAFPFALPGKPVLAIQAGTWTLTVSDAGLMRFLTILLRSWLAVQATVLLTATTQFPDLVHALRHLRMPVLLTSIISFMYRYLFVLADEAMRLLRARESRSARAGKEASRPGLGWQARVAGGMIGQLFLRSFDRSDRVYNAMVARGYTGKLLTMNPHHLQRTDWLTLAFGLLSLILILINGRASF